MIPILETERLILRGHMASDHDTLLAMRSDPEVYRHIAGFPASAEESWRKLLATAGHWTIMGYGYWLVEEKDSGELVGEAGFSDFYRDIQPSLDGTLEAGWALASAHHGKGYASEAVRATLSWAQKVHENMPITCIIGAENVPSIALAEKLGFVERCRTIYKDGETPLYDWAGFPERV